MHEKPNNFLRTASVPTSSAETADSDVLNESGQEQSRNTLVNRTNRIGECYQEIVNKAYSDICSSSNHHPDISAMSVLSLYQNEIDLDSEMDTSR